MKFTQICPTAILLVSSVALAGIRVVGNGAGYIENQVIFVGKSLPELSQKCLQSPDCQASEAEQLFLRKVIGLTARQGLEIQIQSEQENPSLKGKMSLFQFQENRVCTLIFNTDELYRAYPEPMKFGFFEATQHLYLALQSMGENLDLLLLARKVYRSTFTQEKTYSAGALGFEQLVFKVAGFPQEKLYVNDVENLKNMSAALFEKLRCPDALGSPRVEEHQINNFKINGLSPAKKLVLQWQSHYRCQSDWFVATLYTACPVQDSVLQTSCEWTIANIHQNN